MIRYIFFKYPDNQNSFCTWATILHNYSTQYEMVDELYVQKWYQLGQIIEKNDKNVADIVTLLPRLKSFDIRMNYPAQTIPRLWLSSLKTNLIFWFLFHILLFIYFFFFNLCFIHTAYTIRNKSWKCAGKRAYVLY